MCLRVAADDAGYFLQGSVSCCFLPTLTYCQVRDPVTCPEDWVSCGHCLLLFYCLFYLLRAWLFQSKKQNNIYMTFSTVFSWIYKLYSRVFFKAATDLCQEFQHVLTSKSWVNHCWWPIEFDDLPLRRFCDFPVRKAWKNTRGYSILSHLSPIKSVYLPLIVSIKSN
jgi:hypothetical protein